MPARRSRKARGSGKTAIVVALLALLIVLGYLAYSGLFTTVTVTEADAGPFALMVQDQKGDYGQTGRTIGALRKTAKAAGIESEAGCGIFLDNPREVKKENLRAQVGLVIKASDKDKVRRLPAEIKYKFLPQSKCLTAVFPFRTKLSIMAGIMRAYPALQKAVAERKLQRVPALEIYREHVSITYLMPIVPKEGK
jgi:DNA gyrase inhibitor GyrI